jgi:hypothetical protein
MRCDVAAALRGLDHTCRRTRISSRLRMRRGNRRRASMRCQASAMGTRISVLDRPSATRRGLIDHALRPLGRGALDRQSQPRHFIMGIGPHHLLHNIALRRSLALTRDPNAALHYLYVIILATDFK